ncbi:MAG TPA: hypothetical protein VFY06_09135 [Verrucomicrobiae bacterium]|nr:hypothetical protein [Verrucomicrobiae bacterium]
MRLVIRTWIFVSTVACAAGWILSSLNSLNVTGYGIVFTVGAFLFWWIERRNGQKASGKADYRFAAQKWTRRFRRPLPLAFLTLASLALLGGAIYPPNNFDEMTYRLPRTLHWLATGQWHWIHTPDARMNTRAAGFEWLGAPMLAFTRSDRLFFLVNGVSYLLLPGLFFSVARGLGVRWRVAWNWMWLVPSGLIFVLQAGSVANDLCAATYALVAMYFALRARRTGMVSDVWFSILAAALLTGVKASNLPLLLPWLVAVGQSLRLLAKNTTISFAILLLAALVSLLPTALLNIRHCGDWSGSVLEPAYYKLKTPIFGMAGNALELGFANLMPPVSPLSRSTARNIVHDLLPGNFRAKYEEVFHAPFGQNWGTGIQTEDGAGLGGGLTLLLAGSVLIAWFCRTGSPWRLNRFQFLLAILPFVSLLAYMAIAGMGQAARLIAPYYPLLFPLCLALAGQERVVRQRWWRIGGFAVIILALVALVIAPARPLLPAELLLRHYSNQSAFLERAHASYLGNADRHDGLAELRPLLPPEVSLVGFASTGNDIETSLWLPYGTRRVEYILPGDSPAELRQRGLQYIVVSENALMQRHQSFAEWLTANNAQETGRRAIKRVFPPYVSNIWYVAKLSP